MITSFIVDAFAQQPFSGNQAAVCILDDVKPDIWLQAVAAEFNLSETAFLIQQDADLWGLRWFTPTCEVNLCGHATLAAAHVLANELAIKRNLYRFATRSGELTAVSIGTRIQLDFPRTTTHLLTPDDPRLSAISHPRVASYEAGEDFIIELASAQEVRNYQPDISLLVQIPCRGIIITAVADEPGVDFVSRFFAPRAGINEDPVTGSAHCSLADLWAAKLNKVVLQAHQVSARKGVLEVELCDARVKLTGSAITTLRGNLMV